MVARLRCIVLLWAALAFESGAQAQPIYADDPAAAAIVAGWFATLPVSPAEPVVAPGDPPPPDIAGFIANQLAAETVGALPTTELANPAEGPPDRISAACTLSVVNETAEPFVSLLLAGLDRASAWSATAAWARGILLAPPYETYSLDDPYPLSDAAALDRLSGGTYWTARWHQYHAGIRVRHVMRFAGAPTMYEGQIGLRDLPPAGDLAGPGGRQATPEELRAALQGYFDVRLRTLEAIAEWIGRLDARGCDGTADHVRFLATLHFGFGDEYQRLRAMGRPHWAAFNAEGYYDSISGRPVGIISSTRSEAIETALAPPVPVESILGPLSPAPADQPPTLLPDTEDRLVDIADARPPLAPPGPNDERPRAPEPEAAAGWDAPIRANPRLVPGSPNPTASAGDGTRIAPNGIGSWPQPELAGFWRFAGIEDSTVTLLRVDSDGAHFEGWVVRDGAIDRMWLDMTREGETSGWRGSVHISLREPEGACPRWTQGVFIIEPAAKVLSGAWAGPRIEPSTCAETNEPHGAPIQLDRVVATTFQPIVPGKYIHIIGAPAVGPNPAQYSAAIEFACNVDGLAVASHRVTVSSGRLVDMGACRYQLLLDSPGPYDIAVEFLDAAGEGLHTDRLRADVPTIPGLLE